MKKLFGVFVVGLSLFLVSGCGKVYQRVTIETFKGTEKRVSIPASLDVESFTYNITDTEAEVHVKFTKHKELQ